MVILPVVAVGGCLMAYLCCYLSIFIMGKFFWILVCLSVVPFWVESVFAFMAERFIFLMIFLFLSSVLIILIFTLI